MTSLIMLALLTIVHTAVMSAERQVDLTLANGTVLRGYYDDAKSILKQDAGSISIPREKIANITNVESPASAPAVKPVDVATAPHIPSAQAGDLEVRLVGLITALRDANDVKQRILKNNFRTEEAGKQYDIDGIITEIRSGWLTIISINHVTLMYTYELTTQTHQVNLDQIAEMKVGDAIVVRSEYSTYQGEDFVSLKSMDKRHNTFCRIISIRKKN